ncbi:MAG: hypothetical protein ACR2NO_03010 [Chloroflexota bacterium]
MTNGRVPAIARRRGLGKVVAATCGLAAGLVLPASAAAQVDQFAVSGSGVNVKEMPGVDGKLVPLRESFGIDAHFAQCIVEDNPAAFVMPTFGMGNVTIEPHAFFMAMYARQIQLISVLPREQKKLVAKFIGVLDCHTFAGTASVTVGSREASEPATFEIEAVDGGRGGGAAGDSFAFTVFFDPRAAPLNHAIFGPTYTFTGDLVAGEITIAPPVLRTLGVA